MGNSVEQADLARRSGTAIGHARESQVLSISSAPFMFEVVAANTQGLVGSGDGEETVPGMGRITDGSEIDGILAEMAQGAAPAEALSSVGDGSQVPLPGRRMMAAGLADGIRSGDSWSEDERSLPARERHGIQGNLSSGEERRREIARAVESADGLTDTVLLRGLTSPDRSTRQGIPERSAPRSGESAMGLEDHAETVVTLR